MAIVENVSESTGELNEDSTSSIDSPELIAALKRLPTKVALLEHQNERLQNEHKMELEKLTSSFETALALKNDKIKRLEDENAMLREAANRRNEDSERDNQEVEEKTEEVGNDEVAYLPKLNDVPKKSDLRGPKQEATFDECLQLLMDRMRVDHKKELDQMSSTFKTALAFKNRKIKNLEQRDVRKRKRVVSNGENLDSKSDNNEEEEINSLVSVFCKNWSVGEKMVVYVKPSDFVIRAKFTEISNIEEYSFQFVFSEGENEHEFGVLLHKVNDYFEIFIVFLARNGVAFPHSFVHVDLISQKSDEFDYITQVEKSCVGINNYFFEQPKFISCKDLFDENKGYVKDDSIIIDFIVKASPFQ